MFANLSAIMDQGAHYFANGPDLLLFLCGDFCLILENGLGEIFSIFSEALFAPAFASRLVGKSLVHTRLANGAAETWLGIRPRRWDSIRRWLIVRVRFVEICSQVVTDANSCQAQPDYICCSCWDSIQSAAYYAGIDF
jgi:hypothetical protein